MPSVCSIVIHMPFWGEVDSIFTFFCMQAIHPKRWFPRFQDSADNFEFSAERLSENAKSIKITLFAELLTAISPIYVQSLLNLSTKTLKHTICSTKMPHWHQILVIFMIYAILSRNFAVRMYALFPQISLDWKTEFRRRYPFLDVWLVLWYWCYSTQAGVCVTQTGASARVA